VSTWPSPIIVNSLRSHALLEPDGSSRGRDALAVHLQETYAPPKMRVFLSSVASALARSSLDL